MSKITAYAAAASVASTDIIPCVVDPGGTPATKKVTVAVLQTAVLTGGTFVSFGATPATTGEVRLPNAGLVKFRSVVSANDDIAGLELNASNVLFVGTDSAFTAAKQASGIRLYATTGGSINSGIAGTTYQSLSDGNNEMWKPITGSSSGTSPHGVHGTVTTVALTAAQNLVLSAAQYALDTMKVSTAAGGACTVTYPAATDAAGFKKYVWHVSGAGTVAVSNGTVTIAAALTAGQGAWFEFSVAGVAQLTPAFTVLVGA